MKAKKFLSTSQLNLINSLNKLRLAGLINRWLLTPFYNKRTGPKTMQPQSNESISKSCPYDDG